MAAIPDGMAHEQVTIVAPPAMPDPPAIPDPPSYDTANQSRTVPPQALDQSDAQRSAPVDIIQDIQPIGNDRIQRDTQPAPASGNEAIIPINNPKFVTPLGRLDEEPVLIDCPFCHKIATTKVTHNDSSTTQLCGLICCLCCGIIGVLVPYLCHWAQETDHFCTQCGIRVTHKPNEGTVQVFTPPQPQLVPSRYAETGRLNEAVVDTDVEAQTIGKR